MRIPIALVLLLSLTASGCLMARTTTNEPLARPAVERLVPGKSTAQECLELLGAPSEVVQLGQRSAWRYQYQQMKRAGTFLIVLTLFNEDVRQDRVWLFFDPRDVLQSVGSTFEADRARYAAPWQDLSEP